jgi:DNA-binding winged helix-turn-helix (wHTH) protein
MTRLKLGSLIDSHGPLALDLGRLVETRALIQANSGGGKSYVIRKLLEEAHGQVQIILLDVEGEFASLREKFDFVLAGKGGDVPADPRSAELLARKALEFEFSLIVDLYELKAPERVAFVRSFLDGMMNAPRELWHPVLVVLDEIHLFAPEKGESAAANAVKDLATRGRKRGFALIGATQRLSSVAKDVAAQCGNKMIGRTGLDIDVRRASDELGFSSKAQGLALRDLEPGEFFCFGPAISKAVVRARVGEVQTRHPKAGQRIRTRAPVPTKKIQKLLAKLADLPKEAEEETHDRATLRARVKELERELHKKPAEASTEAVQAARVEGYAKGRAEFMNQVQAIKKQMVAMHAQFGALIEKLPDLSQVASVTISASASAKAVKAHVPAEPARIVRYTHTTPENSGERRFGKAEKAMLNLLLAKSPDVVTKAQIAGWTHYSIKSSVFSNALSALRASGLAQNAGDGIRLVPGQEAAAREVLGPDLDESLDLSVNGWLPKLSASGRKFLQILIERTGEAVTREELAHISGYSITSSVFSNGISEICAKKLAVREHGGVKLNPEVLDL